ncbi:MAG: hypothetical protein KC613_22175 [Myxococcales bacterium]|nr:hypothetical protein [Myxococcales bacterium]MCB9524030.1 hypothetical protein [Myxococcales bacterium]
MRPPPIVVVEGLDGVGKSSLCCVLADALQLPVWRTPLDEVAAVRSAVDEGWSPLARQAFHLASVIEASARLERERAAGRGVVLDRYLASTLAYGQAMRDVPIEPLPGLTRPDLTLYLCAPVDVRRDRLAARAARRGRISGEDHRTLNEAADARLARAYAEALALPGHGRVCMIDASGKLEDVARAALAAIAEGASPPAQTHPTAVLPFFGGDVRRRSGLCV